MTQLKRRLALGGAMAASLVVTAVVAFQAGAQTPARVEKQLLDNPVFNIREITYQPGYKQILHTVAADRNEVLVQITPGKFQAIVDQSTTIGHAGAVFYTPKAPSLHAFSNLDDHPITFLVVQAK